MKYITEADLRDLYRTTPFTTYETEPGTRLTPGARQFLGDLSLIHIFFSALNVSVTAARRRRWSSRTMS